MEAGRPELPREGPVLSKIMSPAALDDLHWSRVPAVVIFGGFVADADGVCVCVCVCVCARARPSPSSLCGMVWWVVAPPQHPHVTCHVDPACLPACLPAPRPLSAQSCRRLLQQAYQSLHP
jgi:hypothetical protein